jgi:hypothetical protein
MYEPGYYKTNYRALRWREMVRWFGLKHGLRNYLKTRFLKSTGGTWMPGLWASDECKAEDLSEEFWHATKPHRKDFEQLGFVPCRLNKSNTLKPLYRDSGGVNYLDPSRRYFGSLIFLRIYRPSVGRATNEIIITFTAAFKDHDFSCTNTRKTFDPLPETRVLRVHSYEVNFIYQEFSKALQRYKETPRQFADLDSTRQWFDARQQKAFEERVKRGLFVRMSDQEVAAAKAMRANNSTVSVKKHSRHLRWAFWLVVLGSLLTLHFLRYRAPHGPAHRPDTMEYAGQEFKMRTAYASYEDYKDDPNNLDTNELNRIEKTMTFLPVPKVFRSREEFVHFLIDDLKFPGYGMGGIGEAVKTDDGSELEIETVEIPQVSKDRVIVVRRKGQGFELIDDFVYSTATGELRHASLVQQTLHYYDGNNHLIREKKL